MRPSSFYSKILRKPWAIHIICQLNEDRKDFTALMFRNNFFDVVKLCATCICMHEKKQKMNNISLPTAFPYYFEWAFLFGKQASRNRKKVSITFCEGSYVEMQYGRKFVFLWKRFDCVLCISRGELPKNILENLRLTIHIAWTKSFKQTCASTCRYAVK